MLPRARARRDGHALPLDEVGSTAYETNNHTLGLALKAGKHLFEAKFGCQDLPLQAYPNQRMDMLDNTQERVNLRDDLPLGGAYLGPGRTMSMNTPMWPWGTAVPGMGRSFYVGVNYRY